MAYFHFAYFALQPKNQLQYPKACSEGAAMYLSTFHISSKRAVISKFGGDHNEWLATTGRLF